MFKLWGRDGFHRHLQNVQAEYHRRRAIALRAIEAHLTGLASWIVPEAGMFFWINIHNEKDTTDMIAELMDVKRYGGGVLRAGRQVPEAPSSWEGRPILTGPTAASSRVMMMPGAVFSVTESPSSYIRTSFAYADEADIVEGFRYAGAATAAASGACVGTPLMGRCCRAFVHGREPPGDWASF